MKGIRVSNPWLTALAAAFVFCTPASPQTWFSDNFDTYPTGNLSGQGGWTGTAGPVKVVNTLSRSSPNSVEADYLTWGAGDNSHPVSSGTGYHYIDVDVAMDTASPTVGENLGYIKMYNSTNGELTRIYYSHQRFKVLLAPASPTVILDGVAPRTWYHIKLGINLTTGLMDVWVDGVQKVEDGPLYGDGPTIGYVTFGQWSELGTKFTKSETYMDNLVCTQSSGVPPGTSLKILPPLSPWTNWEHYNVCFPYVFYDADESIYKMFYSGSACDQIGEAQWDLWQTGIATSSDTMAWTRRRDSYEPVLFARKLLAGELVDPQAMSAIFDSIFAIGPCVLKEGGSYKMWYTGWNGDSESIGGGLTKKINFRIGYATSTDGLEWTKYSGSAGGGSILGLGSAGQSDAKGVGQPYVIKENGAYRMWYEGFDGTAWRIHYATSANGIDWIKQGVALNPGGAGTLDEKGCRNPVIVKRNGDYELWYQGESAASPNFHIVRATSADGLTWSKVAGEITVHPDDTVSGNEKIHVDSIILKPDGSPQVFYAKENTITETLTYGTIQTKSYNIYTEVVIL